MAFDHLDKARRLAENGRQLSATVDSGMPDLISFVEALKSTEGSKRSLLVGNGFSYNYFSYANLLKNAGLETNEPLQNLFERLNTVDFEFAIKTLENAALVEETYNKHSRAQVLLKEATKLRHALVYAIKKVHPDFSNEVWGLNAALQFLSNFDTVFNLNYDVLLYWVMLQNTKKFTDGFGKGKVHTNGQFRGPFMEDAWCCVYNIHGGLHLFADSDGTVHKRLGEPALVEAIGKTIAVDNRLPLYVAEGSSSQKLSKIFGSPYLRFCFSQIDACTGSFFVFGHSADPNDEHIYDKIFQSADIEHLYYCIHQPTADKIAQRDGELARYQKRNESEIQYTFVDSASANVWGAD
jgi:hypothetical protein